MNAQLLFALILGLSICAAASEAAAQQYRVLPADFNGDKAQQMMRAYQRRQVHQALDRRTRELEESLKSVEAIQAYQRKRKEFLKWTLGDMPPRTPLHAQVTGTIHADGYTIEKVLFESRPGFHVTGNLYRPPGEGPFPAILHPCGHSQNGKAATAYQQANQLLVRHGFIVLCFDPIGQGERRQLIAREKPAPRTTGEHQQLGVAGILLGRSLASSMIWDGVRAIDYLASRPDVDSSRMGCTGNSGGGNMTSYLMAYDERIAAAAPGCFMTTHRHKNESPGPGDAEQNLFAQIEAGFDHPDFILTRAPKPTLILCATHDYVPIEGTWEAFRQAKRVYTQLGYPERMDLVEANATHGFSRSLREAAVRFFCRWLQGRHVEAFDDEGESLHSDAQLQVTPTGQVLDLDDEQSLLDLHAAYERELAAKRRPVTREIVHEATGIRPLAQLPQPRVEVLNATDLPRKLAFHPERGIVLPALYWPGGEATAVLMVHDAGMNAAAAEAARLHDQGHPVLVIDVRDSGETKTRNWRFPGADYYIGYMLGRSWLAMRTEDLLAAARWLAEEEERPSIQLSAHGELGPAARHAVALEAELIDSLQVEGGLESWRQLMTSPDAYPHIHNAVHGVLRHYDLPDLRALRQP
jgi:dienelactone hydrolase